MNKSTKFYLILLVIISFAIGITGLSMLFLTVFKFKGLLLAFFSLTTSWSINEEIISHEIIEEQFE